MIKIMFLNVKILVFIVKNGQIMCFNVKIYQNFSF